MTTIARHIPTQRPFILLGAAYAPRKSSAFDIRVQDEEAVDRRLIAASDAVGQIHWLRSDELIVETIDGKSVKAVLEQYRKRNAEPCDGG